MSYHVNLKTGEAGLCKAKLGNCPFASVDEHFEKAADARAHFEEISQTAEETTDIWPPIGLPKKLFEIATFADLLRHFNDAEYDGGEGACLGASAIVSHELIEKKIPHKLIRGEYLTDNAAVKDHWWVESSGWIIDPSRGQFHEKIYKNGVVRNSSKSYRKLNEWPGGHETMDHVEAELKRCFGDPLEAESYLAIALNIRDEAGHL